MRFELMMADLQSAALATWLRRLNEDARLGKSTGLVKGNRETADLVGPGVRMAAVCLAGTS